MVTSQQDSGPAPSHVCLCKVCSFVQRGVANRRGSTPRWTACTGGPSDACLPTCRGSTGGLAQGTCSEEWQTWEGHPTMGAAAGHVLHAAQRRHKCSVRSISEPRGPTGPGRPAHCPTAGHQGPGCSSRAVVPDTQPRSPRPGREHSHPQCYPPTACHHFTPPECAWARCPGNGTPARCYPSRSSKHL